MLHGFVLKNLEREGLVSSTSFHFDDVESVVVDGLFDCRSSVLDVAELTFLGAQRLSFLPGALEIFLSKSRTLSPGVSSATIMSKCMIPLLFFVT
jgi:hypothetical protein